MKAIIPKIQKRTAKESELHSNKKYWQQVRTNLSKILEDWKKEEISIKRIGRKINALCGIREKDEWYQVDKDNRIEVTEFLEDLVEITGTYMFGKISKPKFDIELEIKLKSLISEMENELINPSINRPSVNSILKNIKDLIFIGKELG